MYKTISLLRNLAIGLALLATSATAFAISLIPFTSFVFNFPIGIDFHEETGTFAPGRLLMSVNYSTGEDHNLDLVSAGGTPTPFSTLHGLTNEVKVATVRQSACMQTFAVGEAFTGNGSAGQVVRIAPDGSSFLNPWVSLPGEPALIRGSLFQDRFCAAGGDLIVVTGNEQEAGNLANNNVGNVWRVSSTATLNCSVGCTQLTNNIPTHLEGVTTVVNSAAVYGPLAGKILAGAEEFDNTAGPPTYATGGGKIYAVDPSSTTSTNLWFTISAGLPNTCSLDVNGKATPNNCNFQPVDSSGNPLATPFHPEDLDIIRRDSAFFGVDFGDGVVLTASASDPDLVDRCGQVFITQEFPVANHSGLFAMRWDPTLMKFVVDELPLIAVLGSATAGVTSIGQWEHVTFTSGQDCNTQIKIVKTPDGAKFNVGDAIFFDIVVSNVGSSDATDVKLSDPLPTAGGVLTWGVTSVTPGPITLCSIDASQTLNCNFGTLAPGASQTVRVTITNVGGAPAASCTPGTPLKNLATATSSSASNSPVTDPGDYTCNGTTLKVVKTPDGGTFAPGAQVTYSIVVSNTGPNTAINATLSDQLPTNGGLTWTSASSTQGTCLISPTYLLTCNFGDIPVGGSVTVTVKSPATTPAAACQSQPNPHAIAMADNAPSNEDGGSQSCTPVNLVTVTQGGWGAPAHGNNPGTVLNAYFSAHPGYAPKIGDITNACSGKTLTFTSANAIRAFLPAGGPPAVLNATATNPTSSSAGVFAGQVLALTLNTQVLSSGSSLLSFVLTSGPATGKTVGEVLADADKALGGCGLPSYVTSISQLNDIVDTINNMFD